MLEPDSRAVLLDQLRPPPGYQLEGALATTFTLDMTTALIPPLAFASFEIRGTSDPVATLEAVRSCTDRVDVFCQAGQLAVPAQHSDLMAYLEPMVHPVRRPRRGYLFHPKVWFLRYSADGQADRFRLLCSTRNLTASTAWDAVVSLDGRPSGRALPANRPLAAFLRHVPTLTVGALDPARTARIHALADAAEQVEWDLPPHVDEIVFHAIGIPGRATGPDFSGYRHLVVSPFCDEEGLAHLTAGSREVTVVSRPEALDRLDPAALRKASTRILDPLAVLGSPGDETDGVQDGGHDDTPVVPSSTHHPEVDTLSGLHAKITVVEREWKAHVVIGSPNATSAAYGGNLEFAVELVGRPKRLGVATYLGPEAPFAGILQEYASGGGEPPDPEEELLRSLRNQLRALAEIPLSLTVQSAGEGVYALHLESATALPSRPGCSVRAELLTRPGHAVRLTPGETVDAVFSPVPLADVTPFVALFVRDDEHSTVSRPLELSTVVHAPLDGDPPSRLDEVLARQVNTPEKFLRFLALLLKVGDGSPLLAAADAAADGGSWGFVSGRGAGTFEIVVTALATDPGALRDFDRLVERLESTEAGRAVLPGGFGSFWTPVRGALATLDDRTGRERS
ncbi:phospholipase D family protein [Promicromonospora sp. Marseille-Q5078]